MAQGINIETNPAALRSVASSINAYTTVQHNIMSQYSIQMSTLCEEIQVAGFKDALAAIAEWTRRMEDLQADGNAYANFLNQKADMLEHFQNS